MISATAHSFAIGGCRRRRVNAQSFLEQPARSSVECAASFRGDARRKLDHAGKVLAAPERGGWNQDSSGS